MFSGQKKIGLKGKKCILLDTWSGWRAVPLGPKKSPTFKSGAEVYLCIVFNCGSVFRVTCLFAAGYFRFQPLPSLVISILW